MMIKRRNKAIWGVLSVLLLFGITLRLEAPLQAQTVDYAAHYTEDYDRMNPVSWQQLTTPYAETYFPECGLTLGECGSGVHALTVLLIKSGYWELGQTVSEGYQLAKDYGIIEQVGKTPSYKWENIKQATNGQITYVEERWGATKADLQKVYDEGYLAIMATSLNEDEPCGGGHLVNLDYMESLEAVIVDSATRGKYLESQAGGCMRNIHIFKVRDKGTSDYIKLWEGQPFTIQR